jgi:hypothetical protein
MNIINDKVVGEIILNENTELHGMIVGNTTVTEGILLKLHGMIIGDLILEKDSTVYLHGMTKGDVINRGEILKVYGMVNGRIIRQDGETLVDSKAVVRYGIS